MSPNYNKDAATMYPNHEGCDISVVDAAKMEVEDFNVEGGYDFLVVDGTKFSGSSQPQGVQPKTGISWSSDYSVTKTGWKICPKVIPPPPVPNSKTSKGCDCKASWSYGGVSASFCDNPDSDPRGVWCAVVDSSCQGSWWGYC